MKQKSSLIRSGAIICGIVVILSTLIYFKIDHSGYITYQINPKKVDIKLYWKDDNDQPLQSIQALKNFVEKGTSTLLFAMNGGMYRPDHSPVGLYIEKGKILCPLDTATGVGNFYLKPNGVFYLTQERTAHICITNDFPKNTSVSYATQSGPMLLIDGQINALFQKNSTNLNIRNAVGIRPDGQLVFAISKEPVSFYNLAAQFKKLGCTNALYLDGFVSRTYLPEKNWLQYDGDFGVIIGVTKP